MIKRVEGWELLLEEYLRSTALVPFKWGLCDCALWSGDWFGILTGADVCKDVRGTYSTEAEASERIAALGGFGEEIGRRIPERKKNFEKRGDLALCIIGGKETLGIVGAGGFVFFKTVKGVAARKVRPERAWGVD